MPIPLLVWAVAGAATAYVAWKNRDTLGKALSEVAEGTANYVSEKTKAVEPIVQELMELPLKEGYEYIENVVPTMNDEHYSAFLLVLRLMSENNAKAKAFHKKASDMR